MSHFDHDHLYMLAQTKIILGPKHLEHNKLYYVRESNLRWHHVKISQLSSN